MAVIAFILVVFALVPALAGRLGTESRTGFASPVDWRRLDS